MKRKVGLRRDPEPMIYAKDCVESERRFSRSGERAGNNFVVMDKMREDRRVVPKRYHQRSKEGYFVGRAKVFENSNKLFTVRRDNLEANGGKRKSGIRSKEK